MMSARVSGGCEISRGVHITDEQGRELTDTNGHRLQLYGRCTGRQTSQCGELTALTLALQITQRCRRRYIVGDNLYALAEAAVAGRAGAPEEVEATPHTTLCWKLTMTVKTSSLM